jgi:hypothetical protein
MANSNRLKDFANAHPHAELKFKSNPSTVEIIGKSSFSECSSPTKNNF